MRHLREEREVQSWQIVEAVRDAAARQGLPYDYCEDCAMEFLSKKLIDNQLHVLTDPEAGATLQKAVQTCASRYAFRVRRRRRKVVSMDDPQATGEGTGNELVSRDLGPEDLLLAADLLERLLSVLPRFTQEQQCSLVGRVLEQSRLVDMAEETGRSAHALAQSVYSTCKRMRRLLEGEGLTEGEVAEYLNILDRALGAV